MFQGPTCLVSILQQVLIIEVIISADEEAGNIVLFEYCELFFCLITHSIEINMKELIKELKEAGGYIASSPSSVICN